MLKIKENVDLKELEKFGFHYEEEMEYELTEEGYGEPYLLKYYTSFKSPLDIYTLYIDIGTRIIDGTAWGSGYAEIVSADLIFDLIQAGLVEKVVE